MERSEQEVYGVCPVVNAWVGVGVKEEAGVGREQEKLGNSAVSAKVSCNPTRSSGAGLASESCPQWGQEGWQLGD